MQGIRGMENTISRKKFLTMLSIVFVVLMFSACGNRKESKDEKEIKEVVQKYCDALKIGDEEGEYDCYLPTEKQARDVELGILGLASRVLFKVDLTGVLSDAYLLFGGDNSFAQYKYKVSEVILSEDGTEAVAYVDGYVDDEYKGSARVDMTKYGGRWYVVRGSIADDDREMTAVSNGRVEDGENMGNIPMQTWVLIAATVIVAAAIIFLVLFLRARGGRRRITPEIPPINPIGGGIAPGDIMCSCGMVNPVGIRVCMGCGKKLKRKR